MVGRLQCWLRPLFWLSNISKIDALAEGFPEHACSAGCQKAMQRQTLQGLASGRIDMVVGTHRLLSADEDEGSWLIGGG